MLCVLCGWGLSWVSRVGDLITPGSFTYHPLSGLWLVATSFCCLISWHEVPSDNWDTDWHHWHKNCCNRHPVCQFLLFYVCHSQLFKVSAVFWCTLFFTESLLLLSNVSATSCFQWFLCYGWVCSKIFFKLFWLYLAFRCNYGSVFCFLFLDSGKTRLFQTNLQMQESAGWSGNLPAGQPHFVWTLVILVMPNL